jgi:hypothetical protein
VIVVERLHSSETTFTTGKIVECRLCGHQQLDKFVPKKKLDHPMGLKEVNKIAIQSSDGVLSSSLTLHINDEYTITFPNKIETWKMIKIFLDHGKEVVKETDKNDGSVEVVNWKDDVSYACRFDKNYRRPVFQY